MPPALGHKPSGLMQASGLLFALSMSNTGLSYVFHALASRSLGPGDYGALVSMMALMTVGAVPSQAIQAVMAREAAVEGALGHYGAVRGFAGRLLRRTFLAGAVVAAALALGSPWLARYFHLDSPAPVWGVAATVLIMFLLPVVRGLLQGLQWFGQLGANLIADGGTRLLAGAVLLSAFALPGGVAASAVGGACSLGAAIWVLRVLWAQPAVPGHQPDAALYRAGVPVLAAFGAYAALANLDVMLVKHYFPADIAGYYGAASMVGKLFLFLPFALAQVLFPKASAGHALEQKTFGLLRTSLVAALAVLAAGAVAVWFAAPLLTRVLFGPEFLTPTLLALMRGFGPAVAPLALTYVLVQYHLAVRCSRFIGWLLADIPVLVGLVALFHRSPEQTLLAVGLNHLAVAAIGYWLTPGRKA